MIGDVIANVAAKDLAGGIIRKPNAAERGAVGGQSFDQLMANAEARETRESEPSNRRNENREGDRRSRESNESRQDRQASSQRDSTNRVENGQESVSEPVNEVHSEHEEQADVEEMIDIVAYALAEVVGLPPEVVAEQLKVEVEAKVYPTDLAEPYVANKFLQELLKVETPVELLTMPDYQDKLKKVVEVVTEIAEQEGTKLNLEKLGGMVVTNENEQLVVTMATESLADEDEAVLELLTRNASTQAARVTDAPIEIKQTETETTTSEVVNVAPQLNTVQAAQVPVQTAPLATPAQADPAQVMQQIVSRIKTLPAENYQEIRMALRPAHLGDVTLRIASQNGIVAAMFVAENQRVKEILESQFNQLRNALAEQGISVSELFVSVNNGEAEQQMDQFLQHQQELMKRLQRAAGTLATEEETPAPPPEIMLNNTVSFSA